MAAPRAGAPPAADRAGRGRVRIVLIALLLLAPGLLGLSACGAEGTGDKGYIDGKGVVTEVKPAQRKRPGTLAGTTLTGHKVRLSDYRGHVVVVNVWATWCAPCRAETPLLDASYRKLSKQGVRFLGINTRNSRTDGQAFVRAHGVRYPSIYDPSGQTLLAFDGTLNPSAIPSTVVLDQQGRVASIVLGQLSGASTLAGLVHDARRGTRS